MENIKYYRVSIKFKEKVLSENIDLTKLKDDIFQAKEEFNINSDHEIAMLKVHSKRINLLVRTFQEFKLNCISEFFHILVKEMNWRQYLVEDKNSFELVFAKEIKKEDGVNM